MGKGGGNLSGIHLSAQWVHTVFWNPEPGDFSLIILLRRTHTSHQSAKAHAHLLKAHGHLFPHKSPSVGLVPDADFQRD